MRCIVVILLCFYSSLGQKQIVDHEYLSANQTLHAYCPDKFGRSYEKKCHHQMKQWCKRGDSIVKSHKLCLALSLIQEHNANMQYQAKNSQLDPHNDENSIKAFDRKLRKKMERGKVRLLKSLMNDKIHRQRQRIQANPNILRIPKRRKPNAKKQHSELSVNDVDLYIQGDVELSERQAILLETAMFGDKRRTKRKIGREPIYTLWKSFPISYEISEQMPSLTRTKLFQALSLWETNTCASFLLNGPNTDRMLFYDDGGCSSYVGMIGGTQEISISTPGCDQVGIIAHEIAHSLGAFHEQARPDQYGHISVNYGNIPINKWNNFQPVDGERTNMFSLPYDTGSVMHYGGFGFANDPFLATIETLDEHFQSTIGQRFAPSFLDFAAINRAYKCSEKCGNGECQHDGYPNPNNCSVCLCPEGFGGDNCETVQISECGEEIQVSILPDHISSPNYPAPFEKNSKCIWLLRTEDGSRIILEFADNFDFQCEETCDKSYVEIKRKRDFRPTGYRMCCSDRPTNVFESETNEMIVIFDGKDEISEGFKAKFWSTVQTKLITAATTAATTTTTTTVTATTLTELTTMKPIASTSMTKSSVAMKTTVRKTSPATITIATITKKNKCTCSSWSTWSSTCSQHCGGCGSRIRSRICNLPDDCFSIEKRKCNFAVCPPRTGILLNNGEFHLLWNGCCVGLFEKTGNCVGLANGRNLFGIISDLFRGAIRTTRVIE